ncbi:BrnA antitoxin family protein [Candidatus Saccharibacteria bacterium]|nr:BrnA antitoxin family protein [Candidatus Saccharibacteria bacterium]
MKNAKKAVYTNAPSNIEDALDYMLEHDIQPICLDEMLARSKKKRITLNIDADVLEEYRAIAKENNAKYQPLMNEILREGLKRLERK